MFQRATLADPTEAHAPRLSQARSVKIINPIDGRRWTNQRKAREYVGREMAEWVGVGVAIWFYPEDHRVLAAAARARETAVTYAAEADGGMATLDQVRGLPVIHPVLLLTIARKRSRA